MKTEIRFIKFIQFCYFSNTLSCVIECPQKMLHSSKLHNVRLLLLSVVYHTKKYTLWGYVIYISVPKNIALLKFALPKVEPWKCISQRKIAYLKKVHSFKESNKNCISQGFWDTIKSAYCQILHTSSVHSSRVYCTR